METTQSKPTSALDGSSKQRNAWLWVPSLYFSQGIPYVIVMTMSVVMYKRLGISNTDIAFATSLLYLPWVIKPLWSPIVDITKTKRGWVVTMQFLISIGLAAVAMSVPMTSFFKISLLLFGVMAFASATHDIAADGFYMLSMSKHEQAWWVGLRSTFYRTAMIVGSGLLVVLAGVLESRNGLAPVEVSVSAKAGATAQQLMEPQMVQPATDPSSLHVVIQPSAVQVQTTDRSAEEAKRVIDRAKQWNRAHGFVADESAPAPKNDVSKSWWSVHVSEPFGQVLTKNFPKPPKSEAQPVAGNVGALFVSLSKDPGHEVAVNLGRKLSGIEYVGLGKSDRGFRLIEGERFVFNSKNWNQPAMAVIQLDPKLKTDAAVTFVASSGNIPVAWSITLFVVAGLFLAFSFWHSFVLPRPANDGPVSTNRSFVGEFFATLGSFFKKPGILMAMAFILLYRFDEAQLSKVLSPFLLDTRENGGIGLTTSQLGLAYGTFGILALTGGGLLGGFLAAKHGLKKMLPIMVGSMYLPKLVFLFLSYTQPDNFLLICGSVAVEQFGYGFGFTAFMLYLLYFADGPHKTAHYAICTGFMALGMMLPGMWSGWVADLIGYRHFFIWVLLSAIPGFIIAMSLKVDPQFGKKAEPAKKA
jgi:MFS transporter, PAT family, beta-lactamase induction signal transducer AmpG